MEADTIVKEAPTADKAVKGKIKADKAESTVPVQFIGLCVTDNSKGERTLSPIGRIAKIFASATGENRDRLRLAFRNLLDGVCQQRLKGDVTIETVLTTSAIAYQAQALDALVKPAQK